MRTHGSRIRNAIFAVAVLSLGACAGKGCSCLQPIKGGFPVAKRHQNAIQVRATQSLFQFLSANGPKLIPGLIGGNTFTVPPSCGSQKVCCKGGTPGMCQLSFDFQTLTLTPTAPNLLHLSTDVIVKTVQPLPIDASGLQCDVSIDTTQASPPTMNAVSDLAFTVDKLTNTTGLSASNTNITIQNGAVTLSGGILCTLADLTIKGLIVSTLQSQVATQLQNTIDSQSCAKCMTKDDCNSFAMSCMGGKCLEADGKTCVPSLGIEGRMNVGSALAKYSPGLSAYMDVMLVAGGYAASDTGLSLGMLGGGLGDPHSDCVPVVAPPPMPTIAQSKTFYTDVLPDGANPYHLGIGIHRSHLDTLGWSAFDAGGLCLHVGTPSVALLSTKTIGLIIPSLQDLVHVGDAPMFIALKPSQPPSFQLGRGTYKMDPQGRKIVDDPLLVIGMPGFAIDFFAWVDDRYVRIMTLNSDLELPINLDVDANGKLNPVFGDLTSAFTNVTVTNSDLLAESPQQLAQAFPMILGVAVGNLAGALKGIALPALMGLQVKPKVITSTDPDGNGQRQFLSIFADLGVAGAAKVTADTTAWIERVQLPSTREFAVDARGATAPTVTFQFDGRGPGPLEYSWSVDDGPWSPYGEATTVAVQDPQFWMQGHHAVEVRARVVGAPDTADPSPARLDVVIDTVAPAGSFDVAGHEIRFDAHDAVTPAEAMLYRVSVDGGAWGPWQLGDRTTLPALLDGLTVRVQARDEAGNVGELAFHGRTTAPSASGCGCVVGGAHDDRVPLLPFAVAAAILLSLSSRRRWVWLRRVAIVGGAAVLGATVLAAGGCSSGLGKGDFESPLDEIGRYNDVALDKSNVLHVSAYDDTMGDLVYARITDPMKTPSWQWVDGVDTTSAVDNKGGYRAGISDPGPDVGLFTSIALTSKGNPMIAYFDDTNGALKFARGPHPWTTYAIDTGTPKAPVGLYAAMSLDGAGVPSVVYVATGLPSGAGFKSELRIAVANNANPGASDWTISAIDSAPISCAGRCSSSSACITPAMVNGMPNSDRSLSTCVPVDAMPCPSACAATDACIMSKCVTFVPQQKAADLVEGIGLFAQLRHNSQGQLVVVYYNREEGNLKMATGTAGNFTATLVDGMAANTTTDVGQFCTVALGSDDSVHVAYVDAISDRLLYKHVVGGSVPMTADVVDDGARAGEIGRHSVGAGANLILDGSGNPRVVYQDQTSHNLELATNGGSWSHQDLLTGFPGYGFYPHQILAGGKLYLTEFVYDRQNGSPAPLGSLQISVSAP